MNVSKLYVYSPDAYRNAERTELYWLGNGRVKRNKSFKSEKPKKANCEKIKNTEKLKETVTINEKSIINRL